MADLSPEVQIHLSDLAWKIVEKTTPEPSSSREAVIKERLEKFNLAYKSIVKTITEA